MTQQEWDEMTDQQKHDTILSGTWRVKSRMGVDANSKVGDVSAELTLYAAFSDDIQISEWKENKLEAVEAAVANVKELAA